MKMIVLGAGASHGTANPADVRPPLVEGFFPAAIEAGIFHDPRYERWIEIIQGRYNVDVNELAKKLGLSGYKEHLHLLKTFVSEQLGIEPSQYETASINIERLMGLVEGELLGRHGLQRWLDTPPPRIGHGEALESQLHLVLCGTLMAATRNHECEYHNILAQWLEPGDLVVSFNYDLLVDRALQKRKDWSINDGYHLEFHRVGEHAEIPGDWQEPADTRSAITLLKLHGSLNWLYPRSPAEAQARLNMHGHAIPEPEQVLYCLRDMNPQFEEDAPTFEWWGRYEHWEDETEFDLYSVIVPPSIAKHYRDWEKYLGPLWTKTLIAGIRDVTELIFIGYSLRQEDLRSWWLFTKIAEEETQLEHVRIVDPADSTVQKYKDIFNTNQVDHVATCLEDFANMLA